MMVWLGELLRERPALDTELVKAKAEAGGLVELQAALAGVLKDAAEAGFIEVEKDKRSGTLIVTSLKE